MQKSLKKEHRKLINLHHTSNFKIIFSSRNFTKMPCDHYMVFAKLLFSHAPEDVPYLEEIKTLIKDIFDIRQAKLRTAIDSLLTGKSGVEGANKVSFNNLTILEIHTVRPFLPYASDLIARLERVFQQHTTLNETSMNTSGFSVNR